MHYENELKMFIITASKKERITTTDTTTIMSRAKKRKSTTFIRQWQSSNNECTFHVMFCVIRNTNQNRYESCRYGCFFFFVRLNSFLARLLLDQRDLAAYKIFQEFELVFRFSFSLFSLFLSHSSFLTLSLFLFLLLSFSLVISFNDVMARHFIQKCKGINSGVVINRPIWISQEILLSTTRNSSAEKSFFYCSFYTLPIWYRSKTNFRMCALFLVFVFLFSFLFFFSLIKNISRIPN